MDSYFNDMFSSLPAGYRQILQRASTSQITELFCSPNDIIFEKRLMQIALQPTQNISQTETILKDTFCKNNSNIKIEYNKIVGNIIMHIPQKARVSGISIRESQYGGYEIALLNSKSPGIRYIRSIGYSDINYCDTIDELITEINRIIENLIILQKNYNKKRHTRRNARRKAYMCRATQPK